MATHDQAPASDSRVQTHFDRHVSLYVDKEFEVYRAASIERILLLKQSIRCDSTAALHLLDVGCGCGYFIDLFLGAFPNATALGVDFSAGMLRENTPSPRKQLLQGDALRLPEGIGPFDVINVDTLMHHLICRSSYSATIRQIKQFLESLHSFMTPSGVVMIREIYHEYHAVETLGSRLIFGLTTLQFPTVVEQALKGIGIQSANAGVCFLSRAQWHGLFEEAGFTVAAMQDKPWSPPPYRRFGFKASGDLHYVLVSRPSPNLASNATQERSF